MTAFAAATPIERARTAVLFAVLGIMPLWQEALPALLVLLGLLLLPWPGLERSPGPSWQALRGTPFPWMFLWYMMHLAGLAWTSDEASGRFALEVRALAFFVPLLTLWTSGWWSRQRDVALAFFARAVGAAVLFLTLRSTWLFLAELRLRATGEYPPGLPYTNIFFSSYFSPWIHPSYVAMYAVFALAVFALPRTDAGSIPLKRVDRWLWLPMLVVGVLLTASKSGWIALAVLAAQLAWARWHDRQFRMRWLRAALATTVLFGVLVAAFGTVRAKITDTWAALEATPEDATDSSAARVMVWRGATAVVARSPWTGVGTGDAEEELVAEYARRGYIYPMERRLNAHGQFLQTAVQLGIPAALLLLLAFVLPMPGAIRRRDHLAMFFLIMVVLHALVESVLEVQPGVVFILVMMALLFAQPLSQRAS